MGGRTKRRAGLVALCLYAAAALADAGLHVAETPATETRRFAPDRVIVAIDAGLFWPADMVAALLLAAR